MPDGHSQLEGIRLLMLLGNQATGLKDKKKQRAFPALLDLHPFNSQIILPGLEIGGLCASRRDAATSRRENQLATLM